jgi:kynurenine formamidase
MRRMPSTNRDGLPSKGAVIGATALKIRHASGSPLRVRMSGRSA